MNIHGVFLRGRSNSVAPPSTQSFSELTTFIHRSPLPPALLLFISFLRFLSFLRFILFLSLFLSPVIPACRLLWLTRCGPDERISPSRWTDGLVSLLKVDTLSWKQSLDQPSTRQDVVELVDLCTVPIVARDAAFRACACPIVSKEARLPFPDPPRRAAPLTGSLSLFAPCLIS